MKMIISDKSDYDLVWEVQNDGNEKNYLILYERYKNLIRQFSWKLKKKFRNINSELRKDYEQDAYFKVVKAVDSVDFCKIYDRDNWLLMNHLYPYLQNLTLAYCKKIFKSFYNNIDYYDFPYIFNFDGFVITSQIKEYVNKRGTDLQKEFFNYKCQGYTFHEIKDFFDKSYGYIHLELSKILSEAKNELRY
jgi:hypothetical protein